MNTDDCCSDQDCESGRRNRFFPNKRVTPDTWQVEQDYQQQRRRLINRAIHGWGVVYGFRLDLVADDACTGDGGKRLAVDVGLALDPCGRELVQPGKHVLELADLLAFDEKRQHLPPPDAQCDARTPRNPDYPFPRGTEEKCLLLRAHYAERLIAPVPARDACQRDKQEWDQVCETIVYSLTVLKHCNECCEKSDCDLKCRCSRGPCCPADDHKTTERGGCRCLCEHLLELDPTPDCCTVTAVSKVLKVDLRHGVPLACVRLRRDRCDAWTVSEIIDVCGPRRLVKRNDLLFDLIRGCDLTRISSISWAEWHRKGDRKTKDYVDVEEFANKFRGPVDADGRMRTQFWIEFSRPVDVATIKPDCFTMTVIAREDTDGWGRMLRVPIVGVEVDETKRPGYSTTARILVAAQWASGALKGITVFGSGITRCEIAVRGDYLLDCNGQMVDANARGLEPAPTGNGTPGDTFFSTFLISQRVSADTNHII